MEFTLAAGLEYQLEQRLQESQPHSRGSFAELDASSARIQSGGPKLSTTIKSLISKSLLRFGFVKVEWHWLTEKTARSQPQFTLKVVKPQKTV